MKCQVILKFCSFPCTCLVTWASLCLASDALLTSAFSPVDLTVVQVLVERSWAGTMHGLTLTSQTLGFFLQFGLVPGHPPNHMVKKTTRLSTDRNLLHTKREVFVRKWVGGSNYWMCMNEGVQKNLGYSVCICLQKAWRFSIKVQDLIYVRINGILLDHMNNGTATWHHHQLSDS